MATPTNPHSRQAAIQRGVRLEQVLSGVEAAKEESINLLSRALEAWAAGESADDILEEAMPTTGACEVEVIDSDSTFGTNPTYAADVKGRLRALMQRIADHAISPSDGVTDAIPLLREVWQDGYEDGWNEASEGDHP